MLEEYLDGMMLENSRKLDKLQEQMEHLLKELKLVQDSIGKLSRDKNLDTNIFSPRMFDAEADEKIEKAKQDEEKLNQQIDYVRELIETHTKKKIEYEKLISEVSAAAETNIQQKPENEPQKAQNEDELQKFLNELYTKTELCLALLNGDRNKCKAELRNMKNLIKKFSEEMENNQNNSNN